MVKNCKCIKEKNGELLLFLLILINKCNDVISILINKIIKININKKLLFFYL